MKRTYILSGVTEGVDLLLPYIDSHSHHSAPFLIAIDGRCASGKTTLSQALSQRISCPVIHMDHFFLPPPMRTPERLSQPGGNVDRERFAKEVLAPLKAGLPFAYSPFNCHTCRLDAPIEIPSAPAVIVEGSYACHPELADAYDLRVFMTVSPEVQASRISARNGEASARIFATRWIPLEEAYFSAFGVSDLCEMVFDTSFA